MFESRPDRIVGRTFTTVWDERQVVRLHAKLRQLLAMRGIGADGVRNAFQESDQDGEAGLNRQELQAFCQDVLPGELTQQEQLLLWRSLDEDGTGNVQLVDLAAACFPGKADQAAASENKVSKSFKRDDSFTKRKSDIGAILEHVVESQRQQACLQERVGNLEQTLGEVHKLLLTLSAGSNGTGAPFARRGSARSMLDEDDDFHNDRRRDAAPSKGTAPSRRRSSQNLVPLDPLPGSSSPVLAAEAAAANQPVGRGLDA